MVLLPPGVESASRTPAGDPGLDLRASVLAIVPANNEAENIEAVVRAVRKHLDHVLVVDDGSEDETAHIASRIPNVEVLRIPWGGKGGALREGFSAALQRRYSWVLTIDADGQHDPAEIPRFLAAAQAGEADLLVGSRRSDLSRMPRVRRITNLSMSWLISRLARQPIPDSQNGFRMIRADVLRSIPLTTHHFELETEVLFESARAGFRISSVEVTTIYRINGRSHIRKVPDTWRFACLAAREMRRRLFSLPDHAARGEQVGAERALPRGE